MAQGTAFENEHRLPTNLELEAIIRRLEARVEALEQRYFHERGWRSVYSSDHPITIKENNP